MTTVILFIFGLIVGSFLNVVGLRFNSGRGLRGRSFCPRCNRTLGVLDLIPVVSYLFLLGRCRSCKSSIPIQYPLVEIWTGLLFATLFNPLLLDGYLSRIIVGESLILLAFCIYTVIGIYDVRHKIIPDLLSYGVLVVAIVVRSVLGGGPIDWLAGPILFGIFGLFWLLSRGRAMGFGDAKLALSMGLLGGAAVGFSGMIVAFWIGALYGLLVMAGARFFPLLSKGKQITMKTEIPFAPFMILGLWLGLILNLDLLHVSFF